MMMFSTPVSCHNFMNIYPFCTTVLLIEPIADKSSRRTLLFSQALFSNSNVFKKSTKINYPRINIQIYH